MGRLLFALFVIVPLAELYLLIWLGGLMGFWPTVGLVLLTGIVGATLAKLEGLRVLGQWRASLAEGRVPEAGVLDGLLVLVGGILLITPGILTDFVGFSLLIAPTRRALARVLRKKLEEGIQRGTVQVQMGGFGAPPFGGPFGPRPPASSGRPGPRGSAPPFEPPPRGGAIIDVDGRDVTDREPPDEEPSALPGSRD